MKIKNILLVVDYQKDFVDGSLGFEGASAIDEGIAGKIKGYLNRGDIVIMTLDSHTQDYLKTQEGSKLPIEHCIENTNGWKPYGKTGETYEKFKNHPNMNVFKKGTFGSFDLANKLAESAKYLEIDDNCTIEIVGVVTNICVISNAVMCKAALPEAKIVINSSLCGSNDKEMEAKAFDIMKNLQMEVV